MAGLYSIKNCGLMLYAEEWGRVLQDKRFNAAVFVRKSGVDVGNEKGRHRHLDAAPVLFFAIETSNELQF
ncbi:MAG: hypothetical protein HWE39_10880 [Oceanospirillaceae bacterium]|nr:hypothetical protein [Oceanospirillaceae bacterium]